jgi:hypothetical protein
MELHPNLESQLFRQATTNGILCISVYILTSIFTSKIKLQRLCVSHNYKKVTFDIIFICIEVCLHRFIEIPAHLLNITKFVSLFLVTRLIVTSQHHFTNYRLCGLVVRVHCYTTEMYCASCKVRTEFICVM